MAKGKERSKSKEAFWRRLVGRHERSGLSIREFCREHGQRETAFYFWRRELARREGGATGTGHVPAGAGGRRRRDAGRRADASTLAPRLEAPAPELRPLVADDVSGCDACVQDTHHGVLHRGL